MQSIKDRVRFDAYHSMHEDEQELYERIVEGLISAQHKPNAVYTLKTETPLIAVGGTSYWGARGFEALVNLLQLDGVEILPAGYGDEGYYRYEMRLK